MSIEDIFDSLHCGYAANTLKFLLLKVYLRLKCSYSTEKTLHINIRHLCNLLLFRQCLLFGFCSRIDFGFFLFFLRFSLQIHFFFLVFFGSFRLLCLICRDFLGLNSFLIFCRFSGVSIGFFLVFDL